MKRRRDIHGRKDEEKERRETPKGEKMKRRREGRHQKKKR